MNISIFEKKKTISIYLASVFIRNYKSNNNESNFPNEKNTQHRKNRYICSWNRTGEKRAAGVKSTDARNETRGMEEEMRRLSR